MLQLGGKECVVECCKGGNEGLMRVDWKLGMDLGDPRLFKLPMLSFFLFLKPTINNQLYCSI